MKSTTKMMIALLAVLALVATACGAAADKISEKAAEQAAEKLIEAGGNGDVSVDLSGDGEDATIKIESEDESMSIGAGSEMPDGITIPVPDGGTVQMGVTSGDSAMVAVAYDKGRYDEIVSFYESWVADNGGDSWDKQTFDMTTDEGTIRNTFWVSDSPDAAIRIGDCAGFATDSDGLDSICVTIEQGG